MERQLYRDQDRYVITLEGQDRVGVLDDGTVVERWWEEDRRIIVGHTKTTHGPSLIISLSHTLTHTRTHTRTHTHTCKHTHSNKVAMGNP